MDNHTVGTELFYPEGGAVGSLPCTNSGSGAKRLTEDDLVITQPNNLFGSDFPVKGTFLILETTSFAAMLIS